MMFPKWLTKRVNFTGRFKATETLLKGLNLNTVCESAGCPNRPECFGEGTATFMILGDVCTRDCSFCAVGNGFPLPIDPGEPLRIARAVHSLGLRHVVITSVTRDDLPDGGALQFARTIHQVRSLNPGVSIETLIPDFQGSTEALLLVIEARPEVIGHNLETVPSLYNSIRPQADYHRSLELLKFVKLTNPAVLTKSGIMLGLGESEEEVIEVMTDLRKVGCDCLTIGQYLRPSRMHVEVEEYVSPERFERFKRTAHDMGFSRVASAPFVRSSYKAGELVGGLLRSFS
ncbi:MAG TPA: lipoyl synthase [Candidatus Latescibacteria bacterium]|nr:lipoyl synthase [Candidatus Latescibacterota bacterium]